MQPQGSAPESDSQRRRMCRTGRPSSKDVRLTMFAGSFYISNQYPVSGVDSGPQPQPHWCADMDPPWPTYGPDYQGILEVVVLDPPVFQPGYPGSHGHHTGLLNQPCSYSPYGVDQPVENPGGFFSPAVGVGYNDYEDPWFEWEDPGRFSRFGLDSGGPIHLTTNISAASPQVSYQSLSGEVCHCSVRKAHWY